MRRLDERRVRDDAFAFAREGAVPLAYHVFREHDAARLPGASRLLPCGRDDDTRARCERERGAARVHAGDADDDAGGVGVRRDAR